MNVDALSVALRPRPMLEAADLGVRLVQRHARSVWASWLPVALAVFAIAIALKGVAAWLPSLVIFLAKPWLDRTLLFVFSRAAFSQPSRFADVFANWRSVWLHQLGRTLTIDRLTLWRAFTLPVVLLEGQRGAARAARIRQIARGRRGAAALAFGAFVHVEAAVTLAIFSLLFWFAPPEAGESLFNWLTTDEDSVWIGATSYALAVFIVEPFYVASGFAMYLNRRVELEAWDIEQEFRRAFVPAAA